MGNAINKLSRTLAILSMATTGFLAPTNGALAQDALAQDMTAEEIIAALLSLESSLLTRPTPLPGSFGVASGFGLSSGQIGVSIAAISQRDPTDNSVDGSGGAAIGFGDPTDGIGFQMTASINSVSPNDFADSGSLGFMFHKRSRGFSSTGLSSFSIGANRVGGWGDSQGVDEQYYVTASAVEFFGATPLIMTVGYASGADSSDSIFEPEGAAYASFGVRVTQKIAVSAGWDGDEAVAGIEMLPWQDIPLQLSLGVLDLTEKFGDARVLFNISWLARAGN